jgi:hypothetical protein
VDLDVLEEVVVAVKEFVAGGEGAREGCREKMIIIIRRGLRQRRTHVSRGYE